MEFSYFGSLFDYVDVVDARIEEMCLQMSANASCRSNDPLRGTLLLGSGLEYIWRLVYIHLWKNYK